MRWIQTSAAQARSAGQAERASLYRRLLRVTGASLRQAAQVQLLLEALTTAAAQGVRWDKKAANYLGLLRLACALLWFRRYHRLARRV